MSESSGRVKPRFFTRRKYAVRAAFFMIVGIGLLILGKVIISDIKEMFVSPLLWEGIFSGVAYNGPEALWTEIAPAMELAGAIVGIGAFFALRSAMYLGYLCYIAAMNYFLYKKGKKIVCKVVRYEPVNETLECEYEDELTHHNFRFFAKEAGMFEEIGASESKLPVFVEVYISKSGTHTLDGAYFVDVFSAHSIIPKEVISEEQAQKLINNGMPFINMDDQQASGYTSNALPADLMPDAMEEVPKADEEQLDQMDAEAGLEHSESERAFAGDIEDADAFAAEAEVREQESELEAEQDLDMTEGGYAIPSEDKPEQEAEENDTKGNVND